MTAERWNKPPTFWLGGGEEWTENDKIFVHAVTLYRGLLCSSCGMPDHLCKGTGWQTQTSICGPEAAVEQWRKTNENPSPGVKVYPVPSTTNSGQSAAAATAPDWVKQQNK